MKNLSQDQAGSRPLIRSTMLPRREITPGMCYINVQRASAREVLKVDHRTVRYNTYDMTTGTLCGSPHECSRNEFIRWADRPATEEETFHLLYEEMEALFQRGTHSSQRTLEHSMAIETATLMMRNNLINR
jgi:hypothetical protein